MHGFSVRFGLKHTLREVVVVLIANITPLRRVMFALQVPGGRTLQAKDIAGNNYFLGGGDHITL